VLNIIAEIAESAITNLPHSNDLRVFSPEYNRGTVRLISGSSDSDRLPQIAVWPRELNPANCPATQAETAPAPTAV